MIIRLTLVSLLTFTTTALAVDDINLTETQGTLIFADDFNRADASPIKDGLANGWDSNSERRASGRKQATITKGVLTIKTAPGADHNAVIFHPITPDFQNGVIQIRARLSGDESFAVDFNNPECKTVHSGHIINVGFSKRGILIKDSKTGTMDLKIRDQIKAGKKTPALTELLKTKTELIPAKLADGQWHTLTMVKHGNALRITIDGKLAGEFRSPGMTHDSITKVSISAKVSPQLDDLKIWSL